ncbi:hypothetical protein B0F90DRAFT_306522 [Multifurca ochricompacta]|uniref:Transmembrane protein 135 N-terminal domain-containing protein n=1 Tax=Multifurca ochricompacta TaxID=376703 RepID=A0AAD4M6F5_9AGAM|nr:hypothetical protein B0F90DRAFT_306522 [Multifurca ochricompacta]
MTTTIPLPPPGSGEQADVSSLRRESSDLHDYPPRRYTMASFDNLVVLANYEERLREARRMVWRDRGEPAVEVHDLWECLGHGTRGGFRAGTLAFAIRSGVNLILLLARIRKVPRKTRISLLQHALFGADSFRFGAMLGSFVALYRILLNAFPLLFPANIPIHLNFRSLTKMLLSASELSDSAVDDSSPFAMNLPVVGRRKARLSSAAQAHQTWLRKRSARWHSVVAGAIAGGIAISFENVSRRKVIAQQLFVRGLQGSYNAYSEKRGFRVPHGDVLVFALSCAQIMYGFLMRPDTLPKSYTSWINTAGRIPKEAVSLNRDMVRTNTFNPMDLERILARPDLIPDNVTALDFWRASHPPHGPCAAAHPHVASCMFVPIDRFFAVFRWTLPIYGALHVVPLLLFKRKAVAHAPGPMVLRAGWGTLRSAAFLSTFVAIYQGYFCAVQNGHRGLAGKLSIPEWLRAALVSKPSFWVGGLLSGIAVLIEAKHRRGELAMYVLPKGLESAWVAARGKGLVFRTGKHGSALLTAMGMGMVMSTYQNDPQHLSGLVRRILYQFIGPN